MINGLLNCTKTVIIFVGCTEEELDVDSVENECHLSMADSIPNENSFPNCSCSDYISAALM